MVSFLLSVSDFSAGFQPVLYVSVVSIFTLFIIPTSVVYIVKLLEEVIEAVAAAV